MGGRTHARELLLKDFKNSLRSFNESLWAVIFLPRVSLTDFSGNSRNPVIIVRVWLRLRRWQRRRFAKPCAQQTFAAAAADPQVLSPSFECFIAIPGRFFRTNITRFIITAMRSYSISVSRVRLLYITLVRLGLHQWMYNLSKCEGGGRGVEFKNVSNLNENV